MCGFQYTGSGIANMKEEEAGLSLGTKIAVLDIGSLCQLLSKRRQMSDRRVAALSLWLASPE
jgi:hypothetical protein